MHSKEGLQVFVTWLASFRCNFSLFGDFFPPEMEEILTNLQKCIEIKRYYTMVNNHKVNFLPVSLHFGTTRLNAHSLDRTGKAFSIGSPVALQASTWEALSKVSFHAITKILLFFIAIWNCWPKPTMTNSRTPQSKVEAVHIQPMQW